MDEIRIPSASLLLVRDGRAGLEVFLQQRHPAASAFAGALVFPGGKLEPVDHNPALLRHCRGVAMLDPEERAHRLAAIRETYEESGLLLVEPTQLEAVPVAESRDAAGLAAWCRRTGARLALDRLLPFAHWITPRGQPQIFDTRFYLAPAPPGQTARHDGQEALSGCWLRPAEAIAQAERGSATLVFPTWMILLRLSGVGDTDAALALARSLTVVPVRPRIVRQEDGRLVELPPAAGYGMRVWMAADGRALRILA